MEIPLVSTKAAKCLRIWAFTCRISLRDLNSILSQGGLYEKWVADTIMKTTTRSKRRRKEREQDSVEEVKGGSKGGPKALTMTHMQGAFLILVMGFLLAAVTLVGETLHATLSHRPQTFKEKH